jgi:16S rRNA (cytosine1402-N4)-methyltransferase
LETGHEHDPVLLEEVLTWLSPREGQVVIDCTLGLAGHASPMAARLGKDGLLIGIDVDPRNLERARAKLAGVCCAVRLFHASFAELDEVLNAAGIDRVDAVLADLGLSTNQYLDPAYGMSFDHPGVLDMRLDPRLELTASDLVNRLPEQQLANVLYLHAQERWSRRIARKIVEARQIGPITTTDRLAEIVRSAIPMRGGAPSKIDPATRTFMALRMEVNRESESLASLLKQAPGRLKPGGRMAVISFHSTEDRAVKLAFRSLERTGLVRILTKKPILPSDAERNANPRSRSAKLRAVQRFPLD